MLVIPLFQINIMTNYAPQEGNGICLLYVCFLCSIGDVSFRHEASIPFHGSLMFIYSGITQKIFSANRNGISKILNAEKLNC